MAALDRTAEQEGQMRVRIRVRRIAGQPSAGGTRRGTQRRGTHRRWVAVAVAVLRVLLAALLVLLAGIGITRAADVPPTVLAIDKPTAVSEAAFGFAVSGIGDLNGDGLPDLVVGAPGADQAYLISGADRTVIRTLEDPDGLEGLQFGWAARAVGDVNGDGVDDVAVGAVARIDELPEPCIDPVTFEPCPPGPEDGRAFVFSGADGGLIHRLHDQTGAFHFRAFGFSIAAPGDVDGDGVPDVAVSAPTLANTSGQVFAFSGADGNLLWQQQELPADRASFGWSMAPAGDINGDGRTDLLVSAPFHDPDPTGGGIPNAGRAYLLSGEDGTLLRTYDNPAPAVLDRFGMGLSSIGDQNGDGVPEYVIGKPGAGMIYLFDGASGILLDSFSSPGEPATDFFGISAAPTDDRDGDGWGDFWVGASSSGILYLLNRSGDVLCEVPDPTGGTGVPMFGFGWRLAPTGDLGGGTGPDLLVGAPAEILSEGGGADAAYLVLLPPPNRPPVADAGPDQTVECAGAATGVMLDGTGSSDPDGDPLTYEWREGATILGTGATLEVGLSLGSHAITLTVTDPAGDSSQDTVLIEVVDTTPPSLTCPPDVSAGNDPGHCSRRLDPGTAAAIDTCDGALVPVGVRGDGMALAEPYPVGTTAITWTAVDASGNMASCDQTVAVNDIEAPVIRSAAVEPAELWPPNHRMVEVAVRYDVADNCDPLDSIVCVLSVASSEPENGTGDGDTAPDWQVIDTSLVRLRAERAATGNGRVYTLTITCQDSRGNASSQAVAVMVPKSRGQAPK